MIKVLLLKALTRFLLPRPAALAAAVFAFLLPLSLIAPAVHASGDDIRVLSSKSEVRFPGDVFFNLEVEGEADIVKVRLYYRATDTGIWTYTYPSVTPSRHVETKFNLNVSGMSYLPPGTEIEYYYWIQDSQGNILKTTPETFVYVDDRFRWQTVDAGPLTIFWHDRSERSVRRVAQRVEESLLEISELLNVSLEKPMRGIIYNSRSEAKLAFPFQSRTITEQQVFQGFAFPERDAFVGIGLDPDLIVHESAHLLLDDVTDSPGIRLPGWVNEGFASYVEPSGHGYGRGFSQRSDPDLIPLRHMYTLPGTEAAIRYFYRKAESVVGHLVETHGPSKFRAFLGELKDGNNANDALVATYGFGLDGLDQRWSSGLGGRSEGGASNGAFPFTYMDTLFLAGLALLALGITASSFVVRRIRKRAAGLEEQDGLTEEEWEGRP